MLMYCLKCTKNAESKNPKVTQANNGKIMLLSKCAIVKNRNLSKSKKLAD